MSGYGRGEVLGESFRIAFEARSVNHRFCRVTLHMPPELGFFETTARQLVREVVQRGKVDLSATVSGITAGQMVQVNRDLAASYHQVLTSLGEDLGLAGDIDLSALAAMPGVLVSQEAPRVDPERDTELVKEALRGALAALDLMRRAEGEHLCEDLLGRLHAMQERVAQIEAMAGELPRRYRDQLAARITALCEDVDEEIDPSRLAQEVAYYADRSDITEELVRLRSHLSKAEKLLQDDGAVGRSLEFLLQELHREINTIGSKAKATEIADVVIEIKSELERIREQVQNIE